MSENISNISAALANFQGEIKNPANTAHNPFFKSKYSPLPEVLNIVRPVLAKHGLSVVQEPVGDGEFVSISTWLLHKSGEWMMAEPLRLKADKVTAQGAGSAITYGRRYALSAVLGISSEDDDDGNVAEGNPPVEGNPDPPKKQPAKKKSDPPTDQPTEKPKKKADQPTDPPKELDKGKVQRLGILRRQKGITDEQHKMFLTKVGVESSKYFTEAQYKRYAEWLEKQPDAEGGKISQDNIDKINKCAFLLDLPDKELAGIIKDSVDKDDIEELTNEEAAQIIKFLDGLLSEGDEANESE
jgi:hypothetical protein